MCTLLVYFHCKQFRALVYGMHLIKRNLDGHWIFSNMFLSYRPESLGVIAGAIFLIIMFFFIPVPFWRSWSENSYEDFPHHRVRKNSHQQP